MTRLEIIRTRMGLSLARLAHVTGAVASALVTDIAVVGQTRALPPPDYPPPTSNESDYDAAQVDVSASEDGLGVTIVMEAIGGQQDGRRLVTLNVNPERARQLAIAIGSVAAQVARMSDDPDPDPH